MFKRSQVLLLASFLCTLNNLRAQEKVNSCVIQDKKTESALQAIAPAAIASQPTDASINQKSKENVLSKIQQPREIERIVSEYVGADYVGTYEHLEPIIISPMHIDAMFLTYDAAGTQLAFSTAEYDHKNQTISNNVKILNLDTLENKVHRKQAGYVRIIAFSPDGKFIAMPVAIGKLAIWNLENNKLQAYPVWIKPLTYVGFSPVHNFLIIAAEDMGLDLLRWNQNEATRPVTTDRLIEGFGMGENPNFSLSQLANLAAVINFEYSSVDFYQYLFGKFKLVGQKYFNDIITKGIFSPDNRFYAAVGQNRLHIFDLNTHKIIYSKELVAPIEKINFLSTNELIFTTYSQADQLHIISPLVSPEHARMTGSIQDDLIETQKFKSPIKAFAVSPVTHEYAVGLENGQLLRFKKKLLHDL